MCALKNDLYKCRILPVSDLVYNGQSLEENETLFKFIV